MSITMGARSRSNKKSKKIVILGGLFLLVVGFGIGWYVTHYKQPVAQKDTNKPTSYTEKESTYQASSEGQTFPVPESVDPDQIKNYELVTENEQYKIRKDPTSNSYVITLYAIINRPDQYDAYRDQLREFKQNALDYLKSKGVDTSTAHISYEPQEAAQL